MRPTRKELEMELESARRHMKQRREMIEDLREEKKQAYYEGYKQGRFDERMNRLNEGE